MVPTVDSVDVYPLLIVDVCCCRLRGCQSAVDCGCLSSVRCGMIIFCTLWMLAAVDCADVSCCRLCGCLSAVDCGC